MTVRMATTLPELASNDGLGRLEWHFVEDPEATIIVVGVLKVSKVTHNYDKLEDPHDVTLRWLMAEEVALDRAEGAGERVLEVLRKVREHRSGEHELPALVLETAGAGRRLCKARYIEGTAEEPGTSHRCDLTPGHEVGATGELSAGDPRHRCACGERWLEDSRVLR